VRESGELACCAINGSAVRGKARNRWRMQTGISFGKEEYVAGGRGECRNGGPSKD
jgi:hypothetical protein